MKNKIVMVMLAVVLIVGLALVGCVKPVAPPEGSTPTPTPKVIKWRMQTSWAGALLQELATNFANRVTELSDGRLEIECLVGGSIVGPFEVLDAACQII